MFTFHVFSRRRFAFAPYIEFNLFVLLRYLADQKFRWDTLQRWFWYTKPLKLYVYVSVAVVICFFLCWAPQHGQRLAYMWAMKYTNDPLIGKVFIFTTYVSGILYYVSTCINPLVYNIMSNKFRQAFKVIWVWSIQIAVRNDTFCQNGNKILIWGILITYLLKVDVYLSRRI